MEFKDSHLATLLDVSDVVHCGFMIVPLPP